MDLKQFVHIFLLNLFSFGITIILSDRKFVKQEGLYSNCPVTMSFGLQNSSRFCAAECERMSICNSFSFNDITKECGGNSDVYKNTVFCDEAVGLRYYTADGVTLGSSCSLLSSCPLQFSKCSLGLVCICESFAFPNPTASRCILNSFYGEQCSVDTDCIGTHMKCEGGYCVCQYGYRADPPDYFCTENISAFGDPCTQHSDCFDPSMECWKSTCTCKPGYSLVPSSQLCVENCTNYGSTYIEYIEWDLNCNSDYHSGLSPQQCKDICSGLPDCLSMSYHFGLSACQTRFCDPMTDPGSFVEYHQVNTFVRNCA